MYATYIVILAVAGIGGISLGIAPSVIARARRRRQPRTSR
jgi:hypothetical protein